MILCNRNREQVLEVTQQQLIIFPLIIARCAEATLRVLLCQTGIIRTSLGAILFGAFAQSELANMYTIGVFKDAQLFVNTPLNRNVLKPTGTGSSRVPVCFGVIKRFKVPVCFGVIKRFKRDNIASSNIMFEVLLGRLRTRNVALKDFCSCFALYCAERCGFADLFGVLPTTFWVKKKFDYIADMPTCRRQRWTIPRGKKTTEQANACSVMFCA